PQPTEPRKRIFINFRATKEYRGFTNHSSHPVTYNGKRYPTSEHLYQAFKFMDNRPDIAEVIRTVSESPKGAYKYSMAHKAQNHPDWDRMCIAKMEIALWHKFMQNADIKQKLLDTGDAELVRHSAGNFWGVGEDEKGRNELGKVLERVRAGLREK
ncbi:DUF1768-domain-containing protein, partial [Mycena albidolilacea]